MPSTRCCSRHSVLTVMITVAFVAIASELGLGRVPSSRSAWRTQVRSVSAVQPSSSEGDRIAAHWQP